MTMLSGEEQARLDQGAKLLADNVPPMLWGLYRQLKAEGFAPEQAFELTKIYLTETVRGATGA